MLKLIDSVTDSVICSGNGKWNEDGFLLFDSIIGVLDGATPIHSLSMEGYNSSAEWLVNEYINRVERFIKSNNDYRIISQLIIDELSLSIDPTWNDFDKPCFVSATASLLNEKMLKIDIIGDCSVYVLYSNNEIELITDSRVDRYSSKTLREVMQARESGRDINTAIEAQKIKNRNMMNINGGYWVVGFQGRFADEYVSKTISLDKIKAILFCTDGFNRAFKEYRIIDVLDVFKGIENLESVVQKIRQYEDSHWSDVKFPCVKKSDDATGMLLSFVKGVVYE